jgi:hypothetical protein
MRRGSGVWKWSVAGGEALGVRYRALERNSPGYPLNQAPNIRVKRRNLGDKKNA